MRGLSQKIFDELKNDMRVEDGKLYRFDKRTKKWREVIYVNNGRGYCSVHIQHKPRRLYYYHMLLYMLHHGVCLRKGEYVMHIDGNRENNDLGNLKITRIKKDVYGKTFLA